MKRVFISTMVMKGMLSNYGTFLQHAALREVIRQMGFSPVRWMHPREETDWFAWTLRFLTELLHIPYWILRNRPDCRYFIREIVPNYKARCKFRREYKKLVAPLKEGQNPQKADVLLMGSDQVLLINDHSWYADAPKDCKRVIYAGSTDWTNFPCRKDWVSLASEQFPKFSSIMIREKAGVEVCRKIVKSDIEIEHVTDPTMLIERTFFDRMMSARQMFVKPTLFCYLVNIYSRHELQLEKYEKLAQDLGCELAILGTQGTNAFVPSNYRVIASPSEFLACFRDSRYVVTNSYHGSVFSILYKKNFVCVMQDSEDTKGQNIRQRELLEQFGLTAKIMTVSSSGERIKSSLLDENSWDMINAEIVALREKSKDLLWKALTQK